MVEEIEQAGIEYHGIAGSSLDCQNAVMSLLQFGERISRVRIISHDNNHCLLLTKEIGDLVAVKSGFSSGYGGTGPTCFSYVLQILDTHGAEIDECQVDEDLINRLDRSNLTISDLEFIQSSRPIRPNRWHDYVREMHFEKAREGTIWREFPPVMPFGLIDFRITDLALSFWQNTDHALQSGYRRLEDAVRKSTGLKNHGERLFSGAFMPPDAKLHWKDINESEALGRAQLFIATFKAYRNPRAHRELGGNSYEDLTEFLLLNHLFLLEGTSELAEIRTKEANGR
jgi:hypothetical protein